MGGKGSQKVGMTTLPPSCADSQKTQGASPPGTLRACPGMPKPFTWWTMSRTSDKIIAIHPYQNPWDLKILGFHYCVVDALPLLGCYVAWPLSMWPISCPKMSVTNYQPTHCNTPEEQRPPLVVTWTTQFILLCLR